MATGKRLFARQASISYTPGSGGSAIAMNNVQVFADAEGCDDVPWTRRGNDFASARGGRRHGAIMLVVAVDDANPDTSLIPVGVVGVLTILKSGALPNTGKIAAPVLFTQRKRSGQIARLGGTQEYTYTGMFVEDASKSPAFLTETT